MFRDETEEDVRDITFGKLYNKLCQYSIFTSGNLFALAGVELKPPEPQDLNIPILKDPLAISDLCRVNSELVTVTHLWRELGLVLGIKSFTLEVIACNHQTLESRFTEMLAAFLNREDRPHDSPGPNWGDVLTALRSPAIKKGELTSALTRKIEENFENPSEVLASYNTVDDTIIDQKSLAPVCRTLLPLNHKWFHLGLALGLSYSTLKRIEASHHIDVGDHMTDVLREWLKGVDQHETGGASGPPSWRALALALDSPLVKARPIAGTIKREHRVIELLL